MTAADRVFAGLGVAIALWSDSSTAATKLDPVPEVSATVPQIAPARPARIAFSGGVEGLPGLIYAQPEGYRPLALDLYLPPKGLAKPPAGFPLVVYIHGGAWMVGDLRRSGSFADFPAVLASLAARGYVVASITYRLSGEARFPAQAIDVRSALRWLRGHATEYGIDPARAATWGVSAGGHLAALAATSCQEKAFDPSPPPPTPGAPPPKVNVQFDVSPCVQAAASWYGVFDLGSIVAQARAAKLPGANDHAADDAPEWRLLGCTPGTCRDPQFRLASPARQVTPATPPMLLIAGTADKTVPHQQSIEMDRTLAQAGVSHRLILMPGLDHSLIGPTSEATRQGTLDALSATFDFFDRTIGSESRR